MKTQILRIAILLLFVLINSVDIYSQNYLNIKDIYSSAPIIDGKYIPYDLNDALRVLDTLYTEEDKSIIKSMEEGVFASRSHFGAALYLRNQWLMWINSRIVVYMKEKYGLSHPDKISNTIILLFDKKLHNKSFDVDRYMSEKYPPNKKNTYLNTYSVFDQWVESEKRAHAKKEGLRIGKRLYFRYPYGCATEKEVKYINKYLEYGEIYIENEDKFPMGTIVNIDYQNGLMLVELRRTIDKLGVIIFEETTNNPRYYNKITPFHNKGLNPIFMKKGDRVWFEIDSNHWEPLYSLY